MKIAVTGKGGVGKSTVAGLLCRAFDDAGWKVLAIDADPDANLASAIGISKEQLAAIVPISHMKSLARERTGAAEGDGMHFILNPKVDDIPERFAVTRGGIKMLLMGTVDHAGGGCVCPEHALIRTLLRHVLTRRDECVVIDMEAGIEHFGRGTVESVDMLIIVVEPGSRSLQTAEQIERLAAQLGVKRIVYVANKLMEKADIGFVMEAFDAREFIGTLEFDEAIRLADRDGVSCYDASGACRTKARALRTAIVRCLLLE